LDHLEFTYNNKRKPFRKHRAFRNERAPRVRPVRAVLAARPAGSAASSPSASEESVRPEVSTSLVHSGSALAPRALGFGTEPVSAPQRSGSNGGFIQTKLNLEVNYGTDTVRIKAMAGR
jgi:hypothetical protein